MYLDQYRGMEESGFGFGSNVNSKHMEIAMKRENESISRLKKEYIRCVI